MMSHGADGSYHLSSARLPPKLSSFKRWRALELREVKHPSPGHPARGRAGTQPPSLSLLLLLQLYPSCLLPLFRGAGGWGRQEGSLCLWHNPGDCSSRPAPPDLEEGSEAPDRQSASWGAAQPDNLLLIFPSSLIPGFLPLITRRWAARPGLHAGLARSRLTGRPGAPNCLAQSPTGSLEVMKSASPAPREAPAPLQEDIQAGLFRGKRPNKQGVQRPGWAGCGGARSNEAAERRGPGAGPAGQGTGGGSGSFSQSSPLVAFSGKSRFQRHPAPTPDPSHPTPRRGSAPFSIPLPRAPSRVSRLRPPPWP